MIDNDNSEELLKRKNRRKSIFMEKECGDNHFDV
jgi:hypothetical protein